MARQLHSLLGATSSPDPSEHARRRREWRKLERATHSTPSASVTRVETMRSCIRSTPDAVLAVSVFYSGSWRPENFTPEQHNASDTPHTRKAPIWIMASRLV